MNKLFFLKSILSINLCLMLFSCSNTKENTLPDLEITDGIAKLSGKITNFDWIGGNKDNRTLILIVPHPVTAEVYTATTSADEDGAFSFEIPMQCNYAVVYFRPERTQDGFFVCLTSGKETKLDIICEAPSLFKITNQTDSLGLTATDLINIEKVQDELWRSFPPEISGSYAKTPDEYVHRVKTIQNYQLKKLAENDVLSETAKNNLVYNTKICMLNWRYFEYRTRMRLGYLNAGNEDVENFNPPEPDKKYYAFLKDYDLNNPQYLYEAFYYYEVLEKILSDEILNIPPIEDMPVNQWMKDVRKILSELVGFNKGLFYDLLATNSYAKQFNDELRPLSDKQKENIQNYFKEDITKILLRKNEEIIRLAAKKEPLIVNETPAVPKEQLMDAVVSKYQGKVVVVDFWATWCAPCLDAMEEYRTVKGDLKGKDVVFVYITNGSSPKKLWEEKIKGIGGEHYYVNGDEWYYLMDSFGFEGIPSYIIFDKKGKLCHKFTGYPGNEKMQKMIEELL